MSSAAEELDDLEEEDEKQSTTQPEPVGETHQGSSHGGDGSLVSLGAGAAAVYNAIAIRRLSEDQIEKNAQKYAEGTGASRLAIGSSVISPYEQAKQDYYNNYVKSYRTTAKVFKDTPREALNGYMQKALTVDDYRQEKERLKKKGHGEGEETAQEEPLLTEDMKLFLLEEERKKRLKEEEAAEGDPEARPQGSAPISLEDEREKRQNNQNKNKQQIPDRLLRKIVDEQRGASSSEGQAAARRFIQRPMSRVSRPISRLSRPATRFAQSAGQKIGQAAARAAQKLGQVAMQLGSKLITAAVSNPYVLAAIIIIVVIVIIFLIIVAIVTGQGNSSQTAAGDVASESAALQGPLLTCGSGDYITCLKDDFDVSLGGTLPSNGAQVIFGILARASTSQTYKSLLTCKGQGVSINVTNGGGASTSYSVITLNGFFTGGKTLGSQTQLLIHEIGHQMYHHNCGRVQQLYDYSTLVNEDPACYDSGYLVTYALRSPYKACDGSYTVNDINGKGESFAETLGDYVAYKSYAGYPGFLCSIHLGTSYKTTCPNTYNWAKTNAFSGVEF
jgi:hypothetical protein